MKKILIGILLLLVLLLGISFLAYTFGKKATITINNHTIQLEIAKTSAEKQIGLSGKTTLAENMGMLFPFGNSSMYTFWMKNMKIPLDIIYINHNSIVAIFKNAKPPISANQTLPLYQSDQPADTVLEINAGLSDKYNFKVGDSVVLKNVSAATN